MLYVLTFIVGALFGSLTMAILSATRSDSIPANKVNGAGQAEFDRDKKSSVPQ